MYHQFVCHFTDNSGKVQNFTVKAKTKADAIDKAFKRARKNACGDLSPVWEVRFVQ